MTSTLRTPELAAAILDLLGTGLSVRKTAVAVGVSEGAIRRWAREDADFGTQYAETRDSAYEAEADDLIDLADRGLAEPELVQALRLAVDTRKWVLSKVLPKKYGDKLDHTHTGGISLTIVDYSKAKVDE